MGSFSSSFYMEQFNRAEESAKLEFEQIDLYEFIDSTIERCSKNSTSNTQKVLDEKLKDIDGNYYEAERNDVYNRWILKIGKAYREDNSIYRLTKKHIEHIPKGTDGRIEKGINFIKDYILNDVGNYQDIMEYIERFEAEVNESMVTECLFKHFKKVEEEQNKGRETEIIKDSEKEKLTLREIALLYYFKEVKITVHNQDDFAKLHGQDNKAQKLYSHYYKRIIDDEKEIFFHRYARKNLESIKIFFEDNPVVLRKIESYIIKCD